MVFGLITAGLGVAQQVMGMAGQAKAAKGGGGGEEPKAEGPKKEEAAAKAGGDGGGEGGAKEANPVDRFVEMIGKAGSLADIKKIRDQALGGLKPEQQENAKRKLDQAILKKLGIGEPGPNGDMLVKLTPQTQQMLQQLGMKPDEVKDGGAGGGPAMGPGAPPQIAANPANGVKPPAPA
jgi:hypothetical protein